MRPRTACTLVLTCIAATASAGVAAAPEETAPLGDLDFALSVMHEGPGADPHPPALPGSALKTDTVTVQAGTKIGDLLRSRSIAPNGDALSAVYLLNPEVRSLDPLEAGTSLVVPSIASDRAFPGALVRLSLVPQTKRELETAAGAIGPLVSQLRELPAERVGQPPEREEVLAALDEVVLYLDEVNSLVDKGDAPLSPEMLAQSLAGATLVREILDQTLGPGGQLSVAERQVLLGVARDMNLKARNFAGTRGQGVSSMRWRDVRVVVAVVQLPGQSPAPGLRVFYAPEALKDRPSAARSFPASSPQAAKRLIEADYVFWAAQPGSSQPVTERLTKQVRRNQQDEIQLRISVLPAREKM